jgi:hypothetical protein
LRIRANFKLAPPAQRRVPHPKNGVKFRSFPAFLPGSGQKVEVTENKPLNPFYPVLEMHNV